MEPGPWRMNQDIQIDGGEEGTLGEEQVSGEVRGTPCPVNVRRSGGAGVWAMWGDMLGDRPGRRVRAGTWV